MSGRENILAGLKQQAYFRAVQMTGRDIHPDDVVIFQEADGTNVILPVRSRYPMWDELGNFERYEYEPWIWVERNSYCSTAFHLVMRTPIHQATFIMFPDWMVLDGTMVSIEVLEGIVTSLWQRTLEKEVKDILCASMERAKRGGATQEVLGHD